jgi:hypothetical protein
MKIAITIKSMQNGIANRKNGTSSLGEGLERTLKYEFLHPQPDSITFASE